MPKITIEGGSACDVPADKRLVNALVDECKIDQLHACGGFAKCTTCRVQFITGEPEKMTQAEKDVLTAKGLLGQSGLRLSCQILCDHDMEVKIVSRFGGSGRKDSGKRPEDAITPPPVWTTE
jgi:ferredoxin